MQSSSYRRRAGKHRHTNGSVVLPDALLLSTVCIVALVGMLAMISIAAWLMESVWHAAMVLAGIGALLYLRQKFHRVRSKRVTWHRGHTAQTMPTVPQPSMLRRAPNTSPISTMPPTSCRNTVNPAKQSKQSKQSSSVYWGRQCVGWIDAVGQMHFHHMTRNDTY